MDSDSNESVHPPTPLLNGASPGLESRVHQMTLRQKLGEVRQRIGYIQKRGYNERHNYNYVAAADIAGTVGDILAELGVVVIPRLESITYEATAPGRLDSVRVARVIMAYSFTDENSDEEITARVAGEGLDVGDKASYKAMTGALKYALLQSFLLATGDDPEYERADSRTAFGSERPITAEQVGELQGVNRGDRNRSRTGARLLQDLRPERNDRSLLSARTRPAQTQTRQTEPWGRGPCPELSGCIRTLPNGIAGEGRGLEPAMLR
jgi:hypothetical protein